LRGTISVTVEQAAVAAAADPEAATRTVRAAAAAATIPVTVEQAADPAAANPELQLQRPSL
jgi:hypothetical protein